MNSNHGGIKKPAVCRYFANSGTCFYGSECQFLHSTNSPVNDLSAQSQLARHSDGQGSHSPALDPLFQSFTPTSALPPESKLQTYINASSRASVSSGDKTKVFVPSGASDVASAMASLNLDTSRKTPVMGNIEYVPSVVNANSRLTHSASTPSFTHYSVGASNAGSTPFGRLNADAGLLNSMGVSHLSGSPGLSPQGSPLLSQRSLSPSTYLNAPQGTSSKRDPYLSSHFQESVAGTTYFYSPDDQAATENDSPVMMNDYHVYTGNPSHVEHMKPKANAPSFFLSDELRMDILHRQTLLMAQANLEKYPELPTEVDNYHNLCPLEPRSSSNGVPSKSATFGFVTSAYKAANIKTGVHYCLRRIHGFRPASSKCMSAVDMWKKLQHSNLVHLREVFTTKSFGDYSMVFVYDLHPGAETLMNQYFSQPSASTSTLNGYTNAFGSDGRFHSHNKAGLSNLRQHAGLLPESLIWAYIVQLSSALRTVHAAGLACRALDPSKILITSKSRLRLNCCGIFDVLSYDPSQQSLKSITAHFQQEDLVAFGKIVLALACNSLAAVQRENLQTSMELVSRNYSADLRNLILYLLSNQARSRNINDIMPMIGARFYTQLDAAQMRSDVIENELAKEVENGRLFRLLVKLGTINERPEFNVDASWSETGDRYLLKLFRDYVFHQVTEDGRPWLDMAHVVQCLNKLDAGIPEKICLMSRDEQNVLVVSYEELKHYFEASFQEILSTATLPKGQNRVAS